jgi:hypothetical protein
VAACAIADPWAVLVELLQSYADIFEEPCGLPPDRRHDHHIHLVPSSSPVAVRPYPYPQLLKDEIGRQCDDMLVQGIIWESTSPFSSPQCSWSASRTIVGASALTTAPQWLYRQGQVPHSGGR